MTDRSYMWRMVLVVLVLATAWVGLGARLLMLHLGPNEGLRSRIEQIRKRDVRVQITDSNGFAVAGAAIQVRQTKHQFAFGTAINGNVSNPQYAGFIKTNFEWAVMENESKWYANEPSRSNVTYTAAVAAEFQLDEHCIIDALLHKVPQYKNADTDELSNKFGPETIKLVKSMAKLGKVAWDKGLAGNTTSDEDAYAEKLRKMLVAMAEDVRVIFIKLACISDEVSKLKPDEKAPEETKVRTDADALAKETMQIYAPIAHRLGIWQLKWQLEDMAFHYEDPAKYTEIADKIKENRDEREVQIALAKKSQWQKRAQ